MIEPSLLSRGRGPRPWLVGLPVDLSPCPFLGGLATVPAQSAAGAAISNLTFRCEATGLPRFFNDDLTATPLQALAWGEIPLTFQRSGSFDSNELPFGVTKCPAGQALVLFDSWPSSRTWRAVNCWMSLTLKARARFPVFLDCRSSPPWACSKAVLTHRLVGVDVSLSPLLSCALGY